MPIMKSLGSREKWNQIELDCPPGNSCCPQADNVEFKIGVRNIRFPISQVGKPELGIVKKRKIFFIDQFNV